ncbi:Major facilitator superfamily domain general substrate transporter [Penicillium mononematosum]|uniref:Major facilitator superfamily domain general substrate transporter n=1 Tax=Penicillium mononematosum TaxID=268346 RepID=UPI00254723F6|nr:Major facilitator superfamily domain general substrate transporter [Penicillium mononematosum]KAJ6180173.1 Major facilitator superfamily domain general substrate transporter [Penicillium mononematosum]
MSETNSNLVPDTKEERTDTSSDGLHGSWAMGIALFGLTFLCALIPKRGGKVPRPGEKGGKDEQGNFVPVA